MAHDDGDRRTPSRGASTLRDEIADRAEVRALTDSRRWADALEAVAPAERHELLWQWWCAGVILADELADPDVIIAAWTCGPAAAVAGTFTLSEWQWWELFDTTGFVTDAPPERFPDELGPLLDDRGTEGDVDADADGLADLTVTVYRGCRTGWDRLSWSLDPDVADVHRDAARARGADAHTFRAEVRLRDILAYVHRRSEFEVVISPDTPLDPTPIGN